VIIEKIPLLNSKHAAVRVVGFVAYLMLLTFVWGALGNMVGPADDATGTSNSQEREDDNLTEEDVEDMIGSQESIAVSDNGYVVVMRPYDENWGSWSYRLYLSDTTDMFEKLFKDPRVTEAKISTYMKGFNDYGNEATRRGASFTMTKETASNINWDQFIYTNLPDVADDAYIAPEILEAR